ncbi:MAG: N-acetylmuramoyl-L-alanine amidase [Candidatus Bipolaricaulota bacterium]|nr:N-acetylmuramoyl-L-alanine amidase [Candidatus Bipolaricaulota bacterium]
MSRLFKVGLVTAVFVSLLSAIQPMAGGPALNTRYIVFVDPGHGGKDPGAIGIDGISEKQINRSIAQMVYIKSLEHPQLRVVLSRRGDEHIYPTDRVIRANKIEAALYVSIHANAYSEGTVDGAETLVHETEGPGSPSYRLAEILQRHLIAKTAAKDRGVKLAPLFIRAAKMPAALVEVGFLTHRLEGRMLQSMTYQDKIATGILAGILEFIDEY